MPRSRRSISTGAPTGRSGSGSSSFQVAVSSCTCPPTTALTRPSLVAVSAFDTDGIRGFLGVLRARGLARTSTARRLAALRGFARYLLREEVVDVDPTVAVGAPRTEKTLPSHLSEPDVGRLLDAPDRSSVAGRRDAAILELFYASGLRLSELTGLDLDDINLNARMVRVLGKGRKQRLVPMTQTAADAIRAYLKDRELMVRLAAAKPEGRRREHPLFVNYRGGRLTPRRAAASRPIQICCCMTWAKG